MSYPTRPQMPNDPPPGNRCAECGEELVPGTAKSVEVQDYVMYFCGLDCYEKWRHEHGEPDSS